MTEKAEETKAITPWRPFADVSKWEREMDRMFNDVFARRMRPWWPALWSGGDGEFTAPVVDVYEEKDEIVVKAELPGLEKNDIQVSISDSQMTLKGEKKKEEKTEGENYYKRERSYGAFLRSVELPTDVQADKVKASFKNGVLEVRLPKSEEAKTKTIKVKID
ncbi:MAG TPA: Hsp20/alpha crystallin family protein [Candidatus Binatia bacterium]|nr:Hsp20/alpha crystallin family protein [Candidatus Binatia bacterium]